MNKQYRSDVRSTLARKETSDVAQCEKTTTLRQSYGVHYVKGTTLRCQRPANAHRIHQAGAIQW